MRNGPGQSGRHASVGEEYEQLHRSYGYPPSEKLRFAWRFRLVGFPLLQQSKTRRRRPNEFAAVDLLAGDKAAIIGILPDGQPGARGAPGVHHLFIGSLAVCQPLKKVEDQRFNYGVAHDLSRLVISSFILPIPGRGHGAFRDTKGWIRFRRPARRATAE